MQAVRIAFGCDSLGHARKQHQRYFFLLYAFFGHGNFADLLSSCGGVVRNQLGVLGPYMDSPCGPLGERLDAHFYLSLPLLGI